MGHGVAGLVLALAVALLAGALVVAAACDAQRRLIPNGCSCVAALAGALRAGALCLAGADAAATLGRALAGGVIVLAVMLAAAALSRRARGEAGVGGGDVKLLAALGLWLGPVGGLACVALSCLVGLALWLPARGLWALRHAWASRNQACSGRLTVRALRHAWASPWEGPARAEGLPLAPGIALAALALVALGA